MNNKNINVGYIKLKAGHQRAGHKTKTSSLWIFLFQTYFTRYFPFGKDAEIKSEFVNVLWP